jgi:hypothetical protein
MLQPAHGKMTHKAPNCEGGLGTKVPLLDGETMYFNMTTVAALNIEPNQLLHQHISLYLRISERCFCVLHCASNCSWTFLVHYPMYWTLQNLKDSENKQ